MQSYRDEIKSAIHLARQDRDDLVPFVGAGISIPAGLPSWSELLRQLAGGGDELSDSLDQPAQALQRIEEKLRTTEFTRRVQQALQVSPESAMTLALYALIQTGVTKIVTTNLDLVIESAFEKAGRPFGAHDVFRGPLPEELAGFDQNHLSCRLFKIHGSLERPSTWVLTQDQYDRAYIEPGPLKSFISQKIRIPFFLGFSFSDFDVDECLRIARIRGKRSYSLVPIDQAPRLDQKLRSKGVIPIYFYNYAQIPEVIDEVFGTRPIEISHRHRTTPEKESVLEVGWAKVPTGEIAPAAREELTEILANAVEPRPNRSILTEKPRRDHGQKGEFIARLTQALTQDSVDGRLIFQLSCRSLSACHEIILDQILPALLRSDRIDPYVALTDLFAGVSHDSLLGQRIEKDLQEALDDLRLRYVTQRALAKVLGARAAHPGQALPPATVKSGRLLVSRYPLTRYQVGVLLSEKSLIEKNPAQPYALRTTREADVILAGLSENVGGHWRLPSEQEWLKLARVQDGRWPWGSDLPRKGVHAHLHFLGEGGGIADHPIEVGVFPNGRTRDGLSDLIGNVYELVTRPGGDLALAGGSWTTNFKSASGFRMIREFRSGQGNVGLRPVCETGP